MYRKTLTALVATLLLALTVVACGGDDEEAAGGGGAAATEGGGGGEQQALSGNIAGAGSSAQEAAMEAWIAGFQEQNPEVTVAYDPVGSGGGREQFVSGGVAFAGSDAALEGEELQAAQERCGGPDNLIEMPAYISPIAVVYNLEGVQDLQLSPETLARIYKGEITNWNDPAIAEDNPNAQLPDQRIVVVHRSDESGTTENLQDYLSKAAPNEWEFEVDGNWPIEGGEAAQGTSGVVDAVRSGQGTIGYADASQAIELGVAKIGVGAEFVEPTPEAGAKILDASEETDDPGQYVYTYDLARETEETGTYPIVLLSYQLACTQYDNASDAELVKGLFEYVISPEGQQAAAENAGSAPISDTLRQTIQPAVDAIGTGGGSS